MTRKQAYSRAHHPELAERLEERTLIDHETGCWEWQGFRKPHGYGQMRFGGRKDYAHRLAYMVDNGRMPPKPLVVRHSCHNPACCNPAHLSSGTQSDNMKDKVDAGRQARVQGERHGQAKLTEREGDTRQRRKPEGLGRALRRELHRSGSRAAWREVDARCLTSGERRPSKVPLLCVPLFLPSLA